MDRSGKEWAESPEGRSSARKRALSDKREQERQIVASQAIEGIELQVKDQKFWDDWVAKNSNDGYSYGVVKYATRWGKLMQVEMANGKSLEDIADSTSHLANNEGITGFMYGCAVSMLSQCWVHGDALKQWHNRQYMPKEKADAVSAKGGVVNPAILTIAGQ